MSFNSIIGHEKIRQNIKKAAIEQNIAHAHIIMGPDGIGKSCVAKEMAAEIIGIKEYRKHVDIVEWTIAENKKSIGVDEVRNIIEEANKRPYECDKKVIVVYTADKITIQGQNAFLKTIEEPSKGIYLIFLVENLEAMLDTIKSRCQIHKLNPLCKDEIIKFIDREYPMLKTNEKEAAISLSEGIPGKIERFFEDQNLKLIRNSVKTFFLQMNQLSIKEVLDYTQVFEKYKKDYLEILNNFLSIIRDVIIYKETNSEEFIINKDSVEEVTKIASVYSIKKLYTIIDVLNDCQSSLDRNVNYALTFDVMLLKIREA